MLMLQLNPINTTMPQSTQTRLKAAQAQQEINNLWDAEIIPRLKEYIAIPAKSPAFDADWQAHGHIDQVVANAADWVRAQNIPGLKLEVLRAPQRTPLIFFEVDGTRAGSQQTIVIYGHLDKQPEFDGWRTQEGLGPWTPKIIDDKLYGRGAADDGYAIYAATAAILALKSQALPHARIVGLIEASEESGSPDLLPYIEQLGPRLGDVGLVICLDSGAGNYEQLWLTTNLRGMLSGTLRIDVLTEGVHSGDASGLVPDSFRIARQLLSRLEDPETGRLLLPQLHCEIPSERVQQARATAAILGASQFAAYPWAGSTQGMTSDGAEALLARTWRPTLTVTGAQGLPELAQAGNVLRPGTALKLSLRLPPLVDVGLATQAVKQALLTDAPYQAQTSFSNARGANGWNAPPMDAWFEQALQAASLAFYGKPCGYIGQGGSIPLMGQLSQGFPQAQMMVCGVLGPHSNAHGPNEFLHLPYAKRLTAAVAEVMAHMPH